MPLAPVVAAALTSGGSRSKGLYLNGLDVIASPVKGNSYGVAVDSVKVREVAAGQVSSLECVVSDPQAELTVFPGMLVRYEDFTQAFPILTGFLDDWSASAWGIGRRIVLQVRGVETILDWCYVPALTIAAGTEAHAGVQAIAAQAYGVGAPALNTATPQPPVVGSSQAFPLQLGFTLGSVVTSSSWSWAGGTLRRALQGFLDALLVDVVGVVPGFGGGGIRYGVTIDPWLGLRVFRTDFGRPTGALDCAGITLAQSGASGRPADTQHGTNGAGAARQAVVTGPGGTFIVSDGSGVPGPTVAISDTNATSAARGQAIGYAKLATDSLGTGGSVVADGTVTLVTGGVQRRAWGSALDLTDAQAGASTAADGTYPIVAIEKAFQASGDEVWTIAYGTEEPRGSQLLRRLTADTIR